MTGFENIIARRTALLAINVLFLVVWGFAGISKVVNGVPPWFGDKFGKTFLAKFPGLTGTFWLLTLSELLAFGLAAISLFRGEFMQSKRLQYLPLMLAWSLLVFIQLHFGQTITSDFNSAFQLFLYFCGTLITLQYTTRSSAT